MTPFEIDILMHYYSRGGEHPVVVDNPPIWAETRDWFISNDLLCRAPSASCATAYTITERGRAWIEYVCKLPLPEKCWRMP